MDQLVAVASVAPETRVLFRVAVPEEGIIFDIVFSLWGLVREDRPDTYRELMTSNQPDYQADNERHDTEHVLRHEGFTTKSHNPCVSESCSDWPVYLCLSWTCGCLYRRRTGEI